jgi:hypothetical protein
VRTRRLDEHEFKATMTPRIRDAREGAVDVLDIWPYVHSIPATELEGHAVYDDLVEAVYRSEGDRFDHALVMTRTKNVGSSGIPGW